MYDAIQMLPVGQSSTNTALEPLVGIEQTVLSSTLPGLSTLAGTAFPKFAQTTIKLVKTSAALTASNKLFLIWTATTGSGTGYVGAIAGAAAVNGAVAGVALQPADDIATATYFWVAVEGPALVTCPGIIAQGVAVTTDSAGKPTTTGAVFTSYLAKILVATTAADCAISVCCK
jgi:hypothetical protein